jgi:hypothetical protein
MLIELNIGFSFQLMPASISMLCTVFLSGFSKTARSHPGHREAGWHRQWTSASPVRNGSIADDFVESAAERAKAVEADIEADVGDAAIGFPKQKHRALDSPPLEIAVRRLAKGRSEGPGEMRFRDAGDFGKRRNIKRPGVGPIHRVAGAQHAAVDLFDSPAHTAMKSRS